MGDNSKQSRYEWLVSKVKDILLQECFLEYSEITEVDVVVSILKSNIPLGFDEDYFDNQF